MKKISYAIMASVAILTLGSCSEGQYWNEPADKGNVVAFTKPAVNLSIAADATAPSSYEVTINRSQSQSEQTVDVTFETKDTKVLSGPSSVTFKAGENTATYVITIGEIIPGVNYAATLSVKNPEDALTHVAADNLKFNFNLTQQLTWTAAGTASVTETLFSQGAFSVDMQVEEGNWPVAGQRLFRISNLYHNFFPEDMESGTELRFYTDDEGNALSMYQPWSYIGYVEDGEYFFFGCPAAYGGSFTNEGNVYIMNGVAGTAGTLTGEVSPAYYDTIAFQWDCPAK